jgi:hypothetical protein
VKDEGNKNQENLPMAGRKQQWIEMLKTFPQDVAQDALVRPSRRQETIRTKRQGARWIYEDSRYRILEVTTPKAASVYANNTRWPTSIQAIAAEYLQNGHLHIIFRDGHKWALLQWATGEVRDVRNWPMPLAPEFLIILWGAIGKPVAEVPRRCGCLALPVGLPLEMNLPALRRIILDCYSTLEFGPLVCILRSFQGMDLTKLCLDYLPDVVVELMWKLFKMPQTARKEMKRRALVNGSKAEMHCCEKFLAFYNELRWVRAARG